MKKAIITGSGFESADFGDLVTQHSMENSDLLSSLGTGSGLISELRLRPTAEAELPSEPESIFWLRRHGESGGIAPHRINYRANLYALWELGVRQIFAVNTVGGISDPCLPGSFVVPDQIIDLTWGRESTFFDGEFKPLKHIDFSDPFDDSLRRLILSEAKRLRISCVDGGVYACTQGPRLESSAEIRALANQGADLVGMTAMPEAALARELGMSYASICPVVNQAAGLSDELLEEKEIRMRARQMVDAATNLLMAVVKAE